MDPCWDDLIAAVVSEWCMWSTVTRHRSDSTTNEGWTELRNLQNFLEIS